MVIRLVKMTFRNDCVEPFLSLFHQYKEEIRNSEGCTQLQLLRDHSNPQIFFTISTWMHPDFINQYRNSEIFGIVWPQTKAMFAAPAEAWTVTNESAFTELFTLPR
jgi:quinol monooxygenase YgiN